MKRSPYNLIQEVYHDDTWKILVSCVLLNRTNRMQVDKVRHRLFKRWPDAETMASARRPRITPVIKSLGFGKRRAETLIRMSEDYISKEWSDPKELYGLGKYASDAYKIFVLGEKVPDAADHLLNTYQEWLYDGKINKEVHIRSMSFDPNP